MILMLSVGFIRTAFDLFRQVLTSLVGDEWLMNKYRANDERDVCGAQLINKSPVNKQGRGSSETNGLKHGGSYRKFKSSW